MFQANYIPIKEKIVERSKEINYIIAEINYSWSGSPLGYHHNLYYKEFGVPEPGKKFNIEWGGIIGIPQGWGKKEYQDIAEKVYQMTPGIQVEEMNKLIKPVVDDAKDFSLEVVTSLSFIRHYENSEDEMELLQDIEPDKWEFSHDSFLRSLIRRDYYTRDSSVALEGVKYPPHFRFQAQLESSVSPLYIIDKFVGKVKKLTMQINANLPHYKEKRLDTEKERQGSGISIFNSTVGTIQTGNTAQILNSNLLSDIDSDNSSIVAKLFTELLSSIKNEPKLSDFEKNEALDTVGKVVDELSIEKEKQNTGKTTFLFNKLNWVLEKAPALILIIDKIKEYIKLGNKVVPPGVGGI